MSRIEKHKSCVVMWPDNESEAPEIKINSGWARLDCYFDEYGNEGWSLPGVRCESDITDRLNAEHIAYDVAHIGSESDTDILVRENDLESARSAITSMEV